MEHRILSQSINQYNSTGEAVTVHIMKVYNRGSIRIAPLILTLGTRCRYVVNIIRFIPGKESLQIAPEPV
jgi:hypothetical protein